jgi:hypothetical protein
MRTDRVVNRFLGYLKICENFKQSEIKPQINDEKFSKLVDVGFKG